MESQLQRIIIPEDHPKQPVVAPTWQAISAASSTPSDNPLMVHYESRVREPLTRVAAGIIEAGRALTEAKTELGKHGLWSTFIEERLRWQPSTVRMLMKIGSYPPFENVDIVNGLPGDQRGLFALTRIPADQFSTFLEGCGGDLRRMSRAETIEAVRSRLHPDRGPPATSDRQAVSEESKAVRRLLRHCQEMLSFAQGLVGGIDGHLLRQAAEAMIKVGEMGAELANREPTRIGVQEPCVRDETCNVSSTYNGLSEQSAVQEEPERPGVDVVALLKLLNLVRRHLLSLLPEDPENHLLIAYLDVVAILSGNRDPSDVFSPKWCDQIEFLTHQYLAASTLGRLDTVVDNIDEVLGQMNARAEQSLTEHPCALAAGNLLAVLRGEQSPHWLVGKPAMGTWSPMERSAAAHDQGHSRAPPPLDRDARNQLTERIETLRDKARAAVAEGETGFKILTAKAILAVARGKLQAKDIFSTDDLPDDLLQPFAEIPQQAGSRIRLVAHLAKDAESAWGLDSLVIDAYDAVCEYLFNRGPCGGFGYLEQRLGDLDKRRELRVPKILRNPTAFWMDIASYVAVDQEAKTSGCSRRSSA
jgi:hypothetical protein